MTPFLIGLTGGIGSGKSTVARLFNDLGIDLVDTDKIAHQLTAPDGQAMPGLIAAFGPGIAHPDGSLNRNAMRHQVFADSAARQHLESILHPLIAATAQAQWAQATSPYVIVDVPLLLEASDWQSFFDRILVVDCDEETQVQRVMLRSALPEKEVRAILAAQASRQARLAVADDIVKNQGDLSALTPQVEELHRLYLRLKNLKPSVEI